MYRTTFETNSSLEYHTWPEMGEQTKQSKKVYYKRMAAKCCRQITAYILPYVTLEHPRSHLEQHAVNTCTKEHVPYFNTELILVPVLSSPEMQLSNQTSLYMMRRLFLLCMAMIPVAF